jgi:hypothetical protein
MKMVRFVMLTTDYPLQAPYFMTAGEHVFENLTLPIADATQVSIAPVPAFSPMNETPGGLHLSGPLEHESFSDSLLMQFDTIVDGNFGLPDVPMSPTLSMFGDTTESDVDGILEMLDEAMAAFL